MPSAQGKKLVLGIEGSANKIGVGIVTEDGEILSNPRHTYDSIIVSSQDCLNLSNYNMCL
jgi:hypothetical protein